MDDLLVVLHAIKAVFILSYLSDLFLLVCVRFLHGEDGLRGLVLLVDIMPHIGN